MGRKRPVADDTCRGDSSCRHHARPAARRWPRAAPMWLVASAAAAAAVSAGPLAAAAAAPDAACKPARQVSQNRARVLISRRVAAARFGHDVPPGATATVCGAAATAGGPTATDGAGLACGEPNGCDAVATGCHTLPRRLRRPKTIPRPARSGCWRAAPFS